MSQKKRGQFIVIEGIDGVGKTTVAKALSQFLSAQYYKTPPKLLERFCLENGKKQNLRQFIDSLAYEMPQARFLFYLLSLAISTQEIEERLLVGDVVCDRYLPSTLAYHWFLDPDLRGVDISWLSILRPDFGFLLTIQDERELTRRFGVRSTKGRTDSHLEDNLTRLFQIQEIFREFDLVEVKVDNRTVDDIVQKTAGIVRAGGW